jgi:hypothetical protein
MSRARTWLAVLVALPISLVAVGAILFHLSQSVNRCVSWGGAHPGADLPCVTETDESQTRVQAAVWLIAIAGPILLAAVLGIWGVARHHVKMTAIGAVLMILEVFPLAFSFWPLALLAGGGFLWIARRDFEPIASAK